MLLITNLDDIPSFDEPCGLTIGNFDGVHRGHQALLKYLRGKLPANALLTVFTFSNHPTHLFTPHSPVPLICSPLQKVKYLEDCQADIVCLLPFTTELAETSFEEFLKTLKRHLGFSHLVLGQGAALGKNRKGDERQVTQFGKTLGFETDYLPKYLINGSPVSSGRIRSLIEEREFEQVHECLGRPYSLMGALDDDTLHFPGLCLPPSGKYPIRLKTISQTYSNYAHVYKKDCKVRLEIPEKQLPLGIKAVELIFEES